MLTKQQKKDLVGKASKELQERPLIALASFAGVANKEIVNIRKEVRANAGKVLVVKKRLFKLIAKSLGVEVPSLPKEGSLMVVSAADEIAAAKILAKYIAVKENKDKISFVGGLQKVGEQYVWATKEQIKALAMLPDRQQLLAQVVGALKAPMFGLNYALKFNLQKLVLELKEMSEKAA